MGSFDDGTVFDSTRETGEPYGFLVGSDRVVPGFNDAVVGLGVGRSRRHTLTPADAYGALALAAQDTTPMRRLAGASCPVQRGHSGLAAMRGPGRWKDSPANKQTMRHW